MSSNHCRSQKASGGAFRHRVGRRAEEAVADALLKQGYRVLERNVRVGHLEIDLLVRRNDLVAVVEVRYRGSGSWQGPFESVSPAKRLRLRAAGQILWSQRFVRDPTVNRMRFDVAAVDFRTDGKPVVDYVEGAF